jgi:hypothetical protein
MIKLVGKDGLPERKEVQHPEVALYSTRTITKQEGLPTSNIPER